MSCLKRLPAGGKPYGHIRGSRFRPTIVLTLSRRSHKPYPSTSIASDLMMTDQPSLSGASIVHYAALLVLCYLLYIVTYRMAPIEVSFRRQSKVPTTWSYEQTLIKIKTEVAMVRFKT